MAYINKKGERVVYNYPDTKNVTFRVKKDKIKLFKQLVREIVYPAVDNDNAQKKPHV